MMVHCLLAFVQNDFGSLRTEFHINSWTALKILGWGFSIYGLCKTLDLFVLHPDFTAWEFTQGCDAFLTLTTEFK